MYSTPKGSSDFQSAESLFSADLAFPVCPNKSVLGSCARGALLNLYTFPKSISADLVAPDFLSKMKEILWSDIAAEYDAERLNWGLYTNRVALSPETCSFMREWREDEQQHFLFLSNLYAALYFTSHDEILATLSQRATGETTVPESEFTLLV